MLCNSVGRALDGQRALKMSGGGTFEIIGLVSGIATAIGVFFAAMQLRMAQRQETTRFEDEMAREYREIVQSIPTRALLGDVLDEAEYARSFDEFYRYLSLSNEQVFLWRNGRIRDQTWKHWRRGILRHLARPSFRKAWEDIKARAGGDEFGGIRALERNEV
jgi:hypothetical protein